jgi:AraC family transcriptional regulator, transcriptional activator of pobA
MNQQPAIFFYSIDYTTDEKGFYSRAHSHMHYELFYFCRGQATHVIDFESYPITNGSFFMVSYNQVHYIESPPFSHNTGFVLSFNQAYFELLEKDFQHLFGSFNHKPAYYLSEHNPFISILAEQIHSEIQLAPAKSHSLILHYLHSILIHIYRLHAANKAVLSADASGNIFLQFAIALEKHFQEKKTVQAYADLLNISSKQLNRICRKERRQTALAIIHSRLNLEAKRMLFYSGIPIKEICYQLGFEDPSHFSNFFKRINQESPESFRQRLSQMFK